ncbi:MAG: isopentenyl-diphosphate Delta-isomerase [Bacteroidia bacterium]|nr:isopentenyl-diphosphate Delta-isomerase [Bacteroidia bacterium]
MSTEEFVILVDENDRELGVCEKIQAHREGKLHRAFSLIVFNQNDEMLIHKRAKGKYHSAGLWSNSCCSHPKPGETITEAVIRRSKEELGIHISIPVLKGKFIYKKTFENGLTEHELDYVFEVVSIENPQPNPAEVEEVKFLSIQELKKEININPEQFTYWFKEIINRFY